MSSLLFRVWAGRHLAPSLTPGVLGEALIKSEGRVHGRGIGLERVDVVEPASGGRTNSSVSRLGAKEAAERSGMGGEEEEESKRTESERAGKTRTEDTRRRVAGLSTRWPAGWSLFYCDVDRDSGLAIDFDDHNTVAQSGGGHATESVGVRRQGD